MSFSSLPPELVLHTVSTLHSGRDIYALMSVNRGLYRLLKKYLYQYNVDHESSTGLFRAVRIGSLSATSCFLSLPRLNVHVRNNAGQTILHVAAQQHDKLYIMMILLRDSRIDVNATDSKGRTPLSYAASNDDGRPLGILLRHNAVDINMGDLRGQTPFYFAVSKGNKAAVKKLLDDAQLDPNISPRPFSPLAAAAAGDSSELLELLLSDQRVKVNDQRHGYIHPLISAVEGAEGCALRLLRVPNIDVNCCWLGMSALMYGCQGGRNAFVNELLKCDEIDVNRQDWAGRTALMIAIQEGNGELSMALLDRKGIDLTLADVKGKRVLDYAQKSNDSRTLERTRKRLAASNA
ncbi:ankyrin repeat-containing domain protein [Aspergillus californicus]